MKELHESSTRHFEEEIGASGVKMNIQKQTNGEATKIHASVVKKGKEVGFVSREDDGTIVMSLRQPGKLTGEEFLELFTKVGTCLAELLGYTPQK